MLRHGVPMPRRSLSRENRAEILAQRQRALRAIDSSSRVARHEESPPLYSPRILIRLSLW
jgi:hypothetical protein